jgi:hypothetical protein
MNDINSISKIIESIKQHFQVKDWNRFKLWFRGQPEYKYDLVPPVFRQGKDFENVLYWESNMFREFLLLSEAQPFYTKSTFDKLVLMQHYGIPTRLLDWTENLIVGIYFSIYKKGLSGFQFSADNDSALFVLDPVSLNRQSEKKEGIFTDGNIEVIIRASLSVINTIEDYSKQSDIKKLAHNNNVCLDIRDGKFIHPSLQNSIETAIAVFPQQNNPRLINQKGVFTLHGGKVLGDDKLIIPKSLQENNTTNLLKICISKEHKKSIKEELDYCGINESTLFPELSIQSNYIKEKWTDKISN